MDLDFGKYSDIGICVALNLLMSLPFRGVNGVSTFGDIVEGYALDLRHEPNAEEALVHTETFQALKRIVKDNDRLCSLVLHMHTRELGYHPDGLNAAVFTGDAGNFVTYRGTAAGEWNDNAIALLGDAQTNAYYLYDKKGAVTQAKIYKEYASSQQAQAFDYFMRVITQMRWTRKDNIIVTGHSKGGNKAQFVTLLSPLVSACYSFCGQGFAPEAVMHYKTVLGEEVFQNRCETMYSLSSHNDFVNVMGERIVPDSHVYYFQTVEVSSTRQYHELASFIGEDGALMPRVPRGDISMLAQRLWEDTLASADRKAISMAVMTLCEHYYGNGVPINGEFITNKTFYHGGRAAMGIIVRALAHTLWRAGRDKLTDIDRGMLTKYYEQLVKPRADSIRSSSFGQVVGRTIDRIRVRKPDETPSIREIQTGSAEPYFSVDPDTLRINAGRMKRVRQRTLDFMVAAQNPGAGGEPQRSALSVAQSLQDEDMRLQNCEQQLLFIAQTFEATDRQLEQLAAFVL